MTTLPVLRECPLERSCAWTVHNYKHAPHRGMKKEHTRHGPARYLGGIAHSQMQTIETATVQSGECTVLPSTKSEYVRDAGEVIGWDKGEDATWSFVECSGGVSSGRHYHGRPMAESNYKLGGRT